MQQLWEVECKNTFHILQYIFQLSVNNNGRKQAKTFFSEPDNLECKNTIAFSYFSVHIQTFSQ